MHHRKTEEDYSFEKVLETGQSLLLADRTKGILKVSWSEQVNLRSAKIILNQAAILVGEGEYNKVILDRKKLKQFEVDARIWIKHTFLDKQMKLVHKIERVAAIDPVDAKGTIFANFINASIKLIFPSMAFSRFDNEAAALEWLLRDSNPD